MKVGNHNYFLSWREPWHKFEVRWRRADLGLHTPHSLSDLADQPDVDKIGLTSHHHLSTSHLSHRPLFSGLGLVQWTQFLQRSLYGSCVFQYTRRVRDVFRNHEERYVLQYYICKLSCLRCMVGQGVHNCLPSS